jgi:NTE family protein
VRQGTLPSTAAAAQIWPPPAAEDREAVSPPPMERRSGIALALSGGGYRASLFHLGAIRRLNEIGLLPELRTVTGVSGGSITAALMAKHTTPGADGRAVVNIDALGSDLVDLCRTNIRTGALLTRLLPWNWRDPAAPVKALIRRYDGWLDRRRLTALPEQPDFVFCATDMAYGVNWTFARDRVGSYQAGHVSPVPERFTVARAVAASSCFPPVFSPLPADCSLAELEHGRDGSPLRPKRIRGLRLSDGGLYDNLGLEPVWKSHRFLLVSDGGGVFRPEGDQGFLWRIGRYSQIIGRQVGALRKRWLIASFQLSNPRDGAEANSTHRPDAGLAGTYWGIGTEVADYKVRIDGYSEGVVSGAISRIRTDLDSFSEAEAKVLINHGYLLAAAAAERWLRPFGLIRVESEVNVPYPDWMNEEAVLNALRNSHKRHILGRRR